MDASNGSILPQIAENDQIDDDCGSQNKENSRCSATQNYSNRNNNFRNLICFWIIGVCNEFGSIFMSSATFDILKQLNGTSVSNQSV